MNIRHDLGDVNCGRTMAMHGGGLPGHKREGEGERDGRGAGKGDGAPNQETTTSATTRALVQHIIALVVIEVEENNGKYGQ